MMKRAFLVLILVTGVSLNERHAGLNPTAPAAFCLKMKRNREQPSPDTNMRSAIQFSRHTLNSLN